MSAGSGSADLRAWEPREGGPLARVSTGIVWTGFLYAVALLAFVIYHHGRWIHLSSRATAYLLPLATIVLLATVLRSRPAVRIAAALFIGPMLVVSIAANLIFAMPDRTIRTWGWRIMSERYREAIASDLQKHGIRAYPFVTPAEFGYGARMRREGDTQLLPLAGISRVRTVMCAEGALIVSYDSDERGFNNPAGLWSRDSVDVALVGDSFVFGSCVRARDHFATIVRDRFPRTLNVGGLGNGPLTELALLREHVATVRPKRVLWFFFEGNDMEDLEAEKGNILRRYLDPTFTQDLVSRQRTVDSTLLVYTDSLMRIGARRKPLRDRALDLILLRDLRRALNFEVASAERRVKPDFVLLRQVIAEANRTVGEWGGTLTLVYLPEQHRMEPDSPQPLGRVHDIEAIHTSVMEISRDLALPVLDVSAVFARDPGRRAVWWRPRTHYSPYGNRALATAVLAYLR